MSLDDPHNLDFGDGSRELIPQIAGSLILVPEGPTRDERENVQGKLLPIEGDGVRFPLSVYPDTIAFDEEERTLYLLDAGRVSGRLPTNG